MADRLAAKARAEKELLAGVSHELRTPLQRAALLVELGRAGQAGNRDVWGELDRELCEMNELVGQLLASARVDGQALSMRPLDAGELARGVGRDGLAIDCPTPAPPLKGDATLLARALGALVDNARRHAGGATRLVVEGTPEGGVRFVVEDAGPGFAADDLPRVFEPFYRGNGQAHDEQRGVGLGLSLVRRIAEAHGGRAFAMNGPGGGARVGFEVAAAT
jgi:signal transduction histidine kinase